MNIKLIGLTLLLAAGISAAFRNHREEKMLLETLIQWNRFLRESEAEVERLATPVQDLLSRAMGKDPAFSLETAKRFLSPELSGLLFDCFSGGQVTRAEQAAKLRLCGRKLAEAEEIARQKHRDHLRLGLALPIVSVAGLILLFW